MKILITSNGHSSYDQTGEVVDSDREDNTPVYTVRLDLNQNIVPVRDGQFKILEEF